MTQQIALRQKSLTAGKHKKASEGPCCLVALVVSLIALAGSWTMFRKVRNTSRPFEQ